MKIMKTTPYKVEIFIAGDFIKAADVCQKYCDEVGLCVTIEETCYVYTNGRELGSRIGLINYARFPADHSEIRQKALKLAYMLKQELDQESYTVMTPEESIYFSTRKDKNGLAF